MSFDARLFEQRLKASFTEEQAKALASAIWSVTAKRQAEQLTRAEVANLETNMRACIAEIKISVIGWLVVAIEVNLLTVIWLLALFVPSRK